MSPNDVELRSAEFLSALDARRMVVALTGAIAALGSQFLLVTQFEYFPTGQAMLTLLEIPLIPFILIWRKRDAGAWLGILAMALGTLGTVFTSHTSDARISASTFVFLISYFGIVLLRPRWQWPWVCAMALLWILVVPVVQLPFTFYGVTYNIRWGTLLQLLVASAAAMVAWNREFRGIRLRDELGARVVQSRAESITMRERLKVWRDSLIRVHETVLNDIRSVVDAQQIDGPRLLRQLATSETLTPPRREQHRLHELIAPLAVTQTSAQRLTIGRLPDVHLDQERALALRSTLLEVVRNLYRHSKVSTVHIDGVADSEKLRVFIRSDVPVSTPGNAQTGIGVGVVLRDALDLLGGELERSNEHTALVVPLHTTAEQPIEIGRLDTARVMMSAVGAGNAIGGALFFLALAVTYDWHGLVMAVSGVFTAIVGMVANRRRTELARTLVLATAIAATAVPLTALNELEVCSRIELPLIVTALTSLGLFAIVVWAPSRAWWWVAAPFLVALSLLSHRAMDACTASVAPPLIAAYTAPFLMVLMLLASWHATRSAERLHAMRLDEIRQAAAADAAADLGNELHRAVASARSLLTRIAQANAMSDDERRTLRCIDSEIRATIQVDPESAGTMALAARSVIRAASAHGIPTRVLVLRDSGDRRPLPNDVLAVLRQLLLAATDGSASLQILSNSVDDVLTLTISDAIRVRAGLDDGWATAFESGEATLDAGTDAEPALLMIRRQALTPAPDSSMRRVPAH